ncbi:hypothetical protein AB0D66_34540, partial [Streptomyces sp. NPDC048270]|uniref:hypothetical protein n=1 Tax=Streptomyces sp. NPDC048270 TaxID=3154615 RepID=UPI0033DE18DE
MVVEHGGEAADRVVGEVEFGAVVEERGQAFIDVRAAAVRVGGDPAGVSRGEGGRSRGSSMGRPCLRGDGHFHALVVAEVALGLQFFVQDLRTVLSLVSALPQVVEAGVERGRLARWPAHHFLPGAGSGVLADGGAVQAEFPGHRAVAPSGAGQGVDSLEQTLGRAPGPGVWRGDLGDVLTRCRIVFTDRGQGCGQASAVGGGDVLDSAGEALPEVKAVA